MIAKENAVIFSGSSHPDLAREIANLSGIRLGEIRLSRFPDGETAVKIMEGVRGRDTFIVQSISLDPNNYLMELLIIVDALVRASARSVTVVLPYFGYSRQDRKTGSREPITAKLVANMIAGAGATRVLTMDLHTPQLQGFFDIPVDNLFARPLLVDAIKKENLNNLLVVTPDVGSAKLASFFASDLGVDFAIIHKYRKSATEVVITNVMGDIEGKDVLLADDMVSTAETLVSAAKACHEKKAKRILAAITHGLLVGDAMKRIEDSPIEVVYIGNTIPVNERLEGTSKIKIVSAASLFAFAITCILSHQSISSLYEITTARV